MTLRVSKNKLNPTLGLLKSTLIKNGGIIVLTIIAMLIFCPGFFLATLQDQKFKPEDFNSGSPEYLDVLFGACGIISAIFVSIANYISFSYLYKKNSSDVFHALPLTRFGLIISRAGAAFITVLIPLTVGYVSLLTLTAFYPTYVLGTFSQIASAYIMNVICMAFASAYSLIFIICAGSAFDLALSYIGFNSAVLIIGTIISSIADNHLSGYANDYINNILKAVSPIVFCGTGAAEFALGENGKTAYSLISSGEFILQIIILTAVLFIASLILYNHRKAERGGQAYAYKFIYIICSVLAGICGGYLLSRIFIFAADAKDISVIGAVTFIAGALITAVVYGAVTERGFKKFKSSLVYGGISTVTYIIILAVIFGGAFGFTKRVPATSDIKNVSVRFQSEYVELEGTGCEKAVTLHKAVIDKNADDNLKTDVETAHTYLYIEYTLNNGKTMAREYYVDIPKVSNELFALYTSHERFNAMYREIEEITSNTVDLEVYRYDKAEGGDFDGQNEYIVSKQQLKTLIDTYRSEINKVGEKAVTGEEVVMEISVWSNEEYRSGLEIYLTSDFTETMALIDTFELRDQVLA